MSPPKVRGAYSDKIWRNAIRKVALDVATKGGPKKIELAARALVDAAVSGDLAAIRELGDRMDGRPAQTIDAAVTVHSDPKEMSDHELLEIAMAAATKPEEDADRTIN